MPVILRIVEADRLIADNAIHIANNTPVLNPKHQDKVKEEINRALGHMQDAEKELILEIFYRVIQEFRESWKHAQHAIKFANKSSEDDEEESDKTVIGNRTELIPIPLNYTLRYNLSYNKGTPYDPDDDGIENLSGVIDFVITNFNFSGVFNERNLCTIWETFSIDDLKSTMVCQGSQRCCNFVDLLSIRNNWNETFYSYFGLYGTTYNNTVSAQVIYVDYNFDFKNPYTLITYGEWRSLRAIFVKSSDNDDYIS